MVIQNWIQKIYFETNIKYNLLILLRDIKTYNLLRDKYNFITLTNIFKNIFEYIQKRLRQSLIVKKK